LKQLWSTDKAQAEAKQNRRSTVKTEGASAATKRKQVDEDFDDDFE